MPKQVWMMRAGRDSRYLEEFLKQKMVAIGWFELGDLRDVHTRDQFSVLVARYLPDYNKFEHAAIS
jgi:predicted Mrr-cat superfamily restriction endonuclease